ncbi:MAG: transposase [Roseobacter sp.]
MLSVYRPERTHLGLFQDDRAARDAERRCTSIDAHTFAIVLEPMAHKWLIIGPITASATIGDAKQFRTGRDLAAWLGLTPLNKSSGGKERLAKITKAGERYIRKRLAVGMTSRAVMAKRSPEKVDLWTAKIIADKPFRLTTVAMANKAARSIWAMLTKQQEYRQPAF